MKKIFLIILLLCTLSSHIFSQSDSSTTLTRSKSAIGTITPVDEDGVATSYKIGSVVVTSTATNIFTVSKNPLNELQFTVVGISVGIANGTVSLLATDGTVVLKTFIVTVNPKKAVAIKIVFTNN